MAYFYGMYNFKYYIIFISKVRFISTLFLNYIFYLILLVLNSAAFVWGAQSAFDYIISLIIMFDAGTLIILIFSALIKENPSTFWLMCSCSAGHILAMVILTKIFDDHKYYVLIVCVVAFLIYQTMNYTALDCFKKDSKKTNMPTTMSLPFELNLSFVRIIFYVFYGFYCLFRNCCCGDSKNKKKK